MFNQSALLSTKISVMFAYAEPCWLHLCIVIVIGMELMIFLLMKTGMWLSLIVYIVDIICDRAWENWSYVHINCIPLFACTWKLHSCTIQKHQVLDDRWPGQLSQTAFYRGCKATRMHFSALRGINRTAWDTKLLLSAVLAPLWIVPVLVPYWGHSTAAWIQMVAFGFPPSPASPQPPRLPTLYRLNPWYYWQWKNLAKKPAAFK